MVILKCKICGGDIEYDEGKTFCACEYCGTTMTLPKESDEQKASLYNRGNYFRRIGEFDKALAIYENIVREDDTDAEAHWCCVLSRFGIEYVEDPVTYEYLPTCHRASFDNILEDIDYLSAIEHSDGITRRQYQKDAAKIAEVQRGILATSQQEEPFDVFICYKESDDNTKERTRDSVDAQEIYYQLTQEGYRVFFSGITLENKAGTEYEPYIFAALNSAKVMIVVGSKPEYLNAVWVRNEWSRFISLMKNDRGKLLIPCYKEMDPYDLPDQLSILQSYDMTKIGFIQDLIRGVKRVLSPVAVQPTIKEPTKSESAVNVTPLLKRAFMALEDKEWERADDFCEQVLNQEPENAQAYLGKLMAEMKVSQQGELSDCDKPFENNKNYQKVLRFGDSSLSSELKGYIEHINDRNEYSRLSEIYNETLLAMNSASSESEFKSLAEKFKAINSFKDSSALVTLCIEKAEDQRRLVEQKAEEERRLAEQKKEEELLKTLAIVSALENGSKSKVQHTLEGRLEELNTQIKNLESLLNVFDSVQSQIHILKNELSELTTKETKLLERKSQLSIFDVKEKKQVNSDLIDNAAQKSNIIDQINKQKDIVNHYIRIEDVQRDLTKLKDIAVFLKNQPMITHSSTIKEYNFDEALSIYLKEPDVTTLVNIIYPTAIFVPVMLGHANSVFFGSYTQEKKLSPEPIEWEVLARRNNCVLVISKYALECQKYNKTKDNVTWETCSLRGWLNETFFNTAFSFSERNLILNNAVLADTNPMFPTSAGNDTMDKVFLLSIREANIYFEGNRSRQCHATRHCQDGGAGKALNGNCTWWLRSPGSYSNYATMVDIDGIIHDGGYYVNNDVYGVRPAIWINLES